MRSLEDVRGGWIVKWRPLEFGIWKEFSINKCKRDYMSPKPKSEGRLLCFIGNAIAYISIEVIRDDAAPPHERILQQTEETEDI